MNKLNKLRISFNETCQTLSLSRDGLYNLIQKDNSFPKPIKYGASKQSSVFFDYQDLLDWHNSKKINQQSRQQT